MFVFQSLQVFVVVCVVLSPGAANLDVIQEVEYVKEEDKLAYLLDCLQKTAPPVLIFAENKRDVDAIHEFLLVQVRDLVLPRGFVLCDAPLL